MAKTILIPTDLTIESLNTVRGALRQLEGEKVDLVLVYSAYLTDCITDLLFFSKKKYLEEQQNAKFKEACEILKNKYASQLNSFGIDLFTGMNQNAFENFVHAKKVEAIFIPKSYRMKQNNKWCFDLLPYCRKCSLQYVEIDWNETRSVPEQGSIAELFLVPNPV